MLRVLVSGASGNVDSYIRNACGIQVQGTSLKNSIRADVTKERHRDRARDGNAVLDISGSLKVAAGQCRRVNQDRKSEGSQRAARSRIAVEHRLLGHHGNENHGRDRTNIKSAKIVFAAHVIPVERRYFSTAVSSDIGNTEMQANGIAMMVDGMEILGVENVGDRFYVAAQGPARKREGIEDALAFGRVDRIIDSVVADRGRNAARYNPVQRARTGNGAELQLLE